KGISRRRRAAPWLLGLGALAAAVFAAWLFLRSGAREGGLRHPEVPAPAEEKRNNLLKEAALYWSCDADTMFKEGGKTYVRDVSGNDNHGLCVDVEFVPKGHRGGALRNRSKGYIQAPGSLIQKQKEFTIALWVYSDRPQVFRSCITVRAGGLPKLEPIFEF